MSKQSPSADADPALKTPETRKPGRPPHERSDALAKRIAMWVAVGVRVADVAEIEGLSEPTLRKHYWVELQQGHTKANAMVAQSLFRAATHATHPDTRAGMFWLRCRAGWVEATTPPMEPRPGKKAIAQAAGLIAEGGTSWEGLLQ
ncbi:hypothetical protein QTI17_01330 [Variovorax sp. J31P179]|uniref:hypothetical protein n=1 Tax=Variovorax sp. J31P179 TaxID=3053508 RepID=UPI002576152E|nr:hypothetical protein [Variovorax sp. J31P179]MDM0079223.1 hypothetical protein [Variovorax sp. J31P179]